MRDRLWQFGLVFAMVLTLVLMSGVSPSASTTPPTIAQVSRPNIQDAWAKVYEQVSDLPRENQYVNRETGKVSPTNTLVSRMIRYHQFVKGRPLAYRLDWKLTLGDYLGINEPILASSYPGFDNLRTNPMENDRAAINRLTRSQRNALIQALVNVFNPAASQPIAPSPSPQPTRVPPAETPKLPPQNGGARLLLP
ncbi:MAG: hypothetical protein HC780_18115 [Leptolyngbyaceae cyanobacterium CSU_1_3]|nr:hypothetical protein [Leptolyngbyaceae cyanobacterium CSU_1_3]